jgi:8-oxo-dGTP pyrophosphatase MutT (NUDIX family)
VIPEMAAEAAAAFLHAAVREAHEEVGLDIAGAGPIDPRSFPHVGRWVTPEGSPRRYDTHFFLARHRGGDPVPDLEELTEVWWERPRDTLTRIDAGDLEAVTPTVAFLESLARHATVGDAFAVAARASRDGPDEGWTAL